MSSLAPERAFIRLSDLSSRPGLSDAFSEFGTPEIKEIAERVGMLKIEPRPSEPQISIKTTGDAPIHSRIYDALVGAKLLTAEVAMHLPSEWRQKMFRQLDSLHDPEEWEPGDEPVQLESFRTFLRTILALKPSRGPGLGLSFAGNLIGAWTVADDRLTVEFLPEDMIRWVLRHTVDDVRERGAGETTVNRLASVLSPYDARRWFEHAVT